MDTLSKRSRLSILLVILAFVTVVCVSSGGGGQDTNSSSYDGPLSATVYEFSGTVQVLKSAEGVYKDAVVGQSLENNDQVLTHEDGRARIDLSTGTIIRLSPLSNFTFETMQNTDQGVLTRLQLEVGRLWVILNGGEVEVDTPSGLASVRGSYLHVWVRPEENTTLVTCLEGECTLGNEYGTVSLVAGQTASITGVDLPPVSGKMSDSDVSDWLDVNPEATLVLLELTATVAANEVSGAIVPEVATATPLRINTKTPAPTDTAVACGPASDWVLHTVTSGETMDSIATAYQVSVADLQYANCRGDSTVVVVGESLFVPNVATITPTPTKTPLPTATKTPVPAAPTVVPTTTNSPAVFSSPTGPDGTTLSNPLTPPSDVCTKLYSINVTDADGVSEVKMIYTYDGTVPDYNTAVGAGQYKLLSAAGGGTYKANYLIPTYDGYAKLPAIFGGIVKYRFTAKDSQGVLSYYPATGSYSYTDMIKCGAPTYFSGSSIQETDITAANLCARDYWVQVTDQNGINLAELVYKISGDGGVTWTSFSTPLSLQTADTYGITGFTMDTSTITGSSWMIEHWFKVQDNHGNWAKSASIFTFTDTFGCP